MHLGHWLGAPITAPLHDTQIGHDLLELSEHGQPAASAPGVVRRTGLGAALQKHKLAHPTKAWMQAQMNEKGGR